VLPTYIVKGGDYKKEDVVGAKYVKDVFLAPIIEGYSTTKYIEEIGSIYDIV